MRKNHIKLGLSLLTVLATPIIVNTVSSNTYKVMKPVNGEYALLLG